MSAGEATSSIDLTGDSDGDEGSTAASDGKASVRKARRGQPTAGSTVVELLSSDEETAPLQHGREARLLADAASGGGTAAQLNAEQLMAIQSLLVAAATTKVVGPAGTGKTLVAEE